jgi:predicted Fe-Mo cluster-binding NifX family protein
VRIAIPKTGNCLDQHFGHCERFVFLDVDPERKQIISTTEINAPEHQPGLLPTWLKEHNVTLVIAGGIGNRARSLCGELSIEVIAGARSEEPDVLVQQYLAGELDTADHPCEHH